MPARARPDRRQLCPPGELQPGRLWRVLRRHHREPRAVQDPGRGGQGEGGEQGGVDQLSQRGRKDSFTIRVNTTRREIDPVITATAEKKRRGIIITVNIAAYVSYVAQLYYSV